MSITTTKLICDCDYVIYLDDKASVVGFELSPDERQAMYIRYNVKDKEVYPNIPVTATHILEVFAINSVVIWTKDTETSEGELLFYRPSTKDLAIDIAKSEDQTTPIIQDDDKMICGFPIESDNWLPKVHKGTTQWIEVWKKHPEVQERMLAYANKQQTGLLLTGNK